MSSFGEMFRAFGGDDEFSVLKNTKSEAISNYLNQLLQSEYDVGNRNRADIEQFSGEFIGQQGNRKSQAKQETKSIDKFYDGTVERLLSDIRGRRKEAYRASTDRGVAGINKNRSLGFLGGDTPNNSYQNRQAMGLARDAEIQFGLDDTNQEKADLNYLLGNQIGLAGKRGAIGDSVLSRLLYPGQLRSAELGRATGSLGNLNQIEKSNTFYGLQKDRDALDQVSDFFNALGDTVMSAASVYGGMGGGGGGGVKSGSKNLWSNDSPYYGPSGGAQGRNEGSGEGSYMPYSNSFGGL